MPTDPNAPSFDLEDAREISQRLQRGTEPAAEAQETGATARPSYTRFDASHLVPAESTAPARGAEPAEGPETTPEMTSEIHPATISLYAAESWERLLDWFLEITRGDTCFVMDPQGLAAAARGRSPERGDLVGPRLMIALEQAALMQPDGLPPRSVFFEFDDGCVTGISVATRDGSRLTVGVLGDGPIDRALREAVAQGVREKVDAP